MSGSKLLADTNAFIYLLNKEPILHSFLDASWAYTFITEIELLGKPGLKKNEEKIVREMLSTAQKLHFNDHITAVTIQLKQGYRLKLPDAIIAATAIFLEIPLLTADKEFSKIKELDIVLLKI